jgi:hypothetical protein
MNLRLLLTAIVLITATACSQSNSSIGPQKSRAALPQNANPKSHTESSQVGTAQWDSLKAKNLVISKLKKFYSSLPQAPCGDPCPLPTYDVLGEFKFPYKTGDVMVVVGAAGTHDGPLSQGAQLSLFEFEQREMRWELTYSQMEVIEIGQHGFANPEAVKMAEFGNDTYGLSFRGYWMQDGYSGATTVMMARIGNRFRTVLELKTEYDDSGALNPKGQDWTAEFRAVPGPNGFYDLAVTYTGTRKGESKHFTFNGNKYVEAHHSGKSR